MGLELTSGDRSVLLALARATLLAWAGKRPMPRIPGIAAARFPRGAFVTLKAAGALRGCIGHIPGDRPLGEVIQEMTVAAARDDPRFPPVAAEELAELRLEISVLSAPRPLRPVDPAMVRIGRDGLIVTLRHASGLLLPQVALEHALTALEFLTATCRKAGLPPAAWRDPAAEVQLFEAEVFGEGE